MNPCVTNLYESCIPNAPGRRTKASLILFVIAAAAVLSNLVGALCVEADVIGSSDQLVVVALLSVPFILVLLVIGAVLGMLKWHAARKASRCPSRMTVVAASLNLASLLLGSALVLAVLLLFVTLMSGLPR